MSVTYTRFTTYENNINVKIKSGNCTCEPEIGYTLRLGSNTSITTFVVPLILEGERRLVEAEVITNPELNKLVITRGSTGLVGNSFYTNMSLLEGSRRASVFLPYPCTRVLMDTRGGSLPAIAYTDLGVLQNALLEAHNFYQTHLEVERSKGNTFGSGLLAIGIGAAGILKEMLELQESPNY